MSEGRNGLRFDVYERVHLPDDVTGIHELEEIELVPRIQVLEQGDQAILKGQLLLTGVYRGQNAAAAPLSLEHWIPVEISLPMTRVTRLDDISIEIDNFDVDLLSARTLNITGVLSLQGIIIDADEEAEDAWRNEPFTAVHQRESAADVPAEEFIRLHDLESQPYIANSPAGESAAFQQIYEVPSIEEQISSAESEEAAFEQADPREQSNTSWGLFNEAGRPVSSEAGEVEQEQTWEVEAQETSGRISEPIAEPEAVYEAVYEAAEGNERELHQYPDEISDSQFSASSSAAELSEEAEPQPQPQSQQPPEPQPLRVAFQSKERTVSEENNAVSFGSLLQSSKREQAARQAAEHEAEVEKAEELARAASASASSGDDIEWKRLFLNKSAEDSEFRKIRMCIVQKDETLESIALRYSLNPREIVIHNRLTESAVTEGQLIYIP